MKRRGKTVREECGLSIVEVLGVNDDGTTCILGYNVLGGGADGVLYSEDLAHARFEALVADLRPQVPGMG